MQSPSVQGKKRVNTELAREERQWNFGWVGRKVVEQQGHSEPHVRGSNRVAVDQMKNREGGGSRGEAVNRTELLCELVIYHPEQPRPTQLGTSRCEQQHRKSI